MLDQRAESTPSSASDPVRQMRPVNAAKTTSLQGVQSIIGKSLIIKGEITGSESIHIEGKVEGTIELLDDRVTVGRSGRVSANIAAHDIVVIGEVMGNCNAGDHLDIRCEGSLYGDVVVSRISVEEGAYLTGSIDIRRESATQVVEHEPVEPLHVN